MVRTNHDQLLLQHVLLIIIHDHMEVQCKLRPQAVLANLSNRKYF